MNTTTDRLTIKVGDCRRVLRSLPADSVQCVVTSPPYWGLRNYGHKKQLGAERRFPAGAQNPSDTKRRVEEAILNGNGANKRDVWTVSPANFLGEHFATFPPALIKPCILAGTKPGDLVLDPFGGSGTTGMVALEYGRRALLIELSRTFARICRERCNVTPGLGI